MNKVAVFIIAVIAILFFCNGNYFVIAQTPPAVPTVTTTVASNITTTTATSGGNVTSDGDSPVTACGVCWSTSPNPTTANSHTTDGTSTGVYTSLLTGLTPGTAYHIRAYATNSGGPGYGSDLLFTTPKTPTVTAPTTLPAAKPKAKQGQPQEKKPYESAQPAPKVDEQLKLQDTERKINNLRKNLNDIIIDLKDINDNFLAVNKFLVFTIAILITINILLLTLTILNYTKFINAIKGIDNLGETISKNSKIINIIAKIEKIFQDIIPNLYNDIYGVKKALNHISKVTDELLIKQSELAKQTNNIVIDKPVLEKITDQDKPDIQTAQESKQTQFKRYSLKKEYAPSGLGLSNTYLIEESTGAFYLKDEYCLPVNIELVEDGNAYQVVKQSRNSILIERKAEWGYDDSGRMMVKLQGKILKPMQ